MAREYFCAYHSYLKSMRNLSDAECGRLFRALLQYSAGDKSINLQGRESVAFDFIAEQIDRDEEAYKAKCAKLAENGRSRCTQMLPNGSKCTQEKEKGKGEYKENVSYGHEKETAAPASDERTDPCPYAEIMELFNATCTSLPQIRSIDGTRRKVVHARWIAHPNIEVFRELFETAQASSFLTGGSKNGWRASFDWIVAPGNFTKVLEGNYADRKPQKADEDDGRLDFDLEDIFEKPQKESEEEK